MAIGVIKFTYKQRLLLKSLLCFLCILEVCLALTMDSVAAYIYFAIKPVLHTEKSAVGFVFITIIMNSFQVAVHFLFGLKVTWKCLKQAEKKSTRSLLLFWICGGVYFVANLLILVVMSKKFGHHIAQSLAHSFRFGMENYLQDLKWKNFIDNLQYRLACCGIDGYKNWHEVSWLSKYHVNENSQTAKKFSNSDTRTYHVNPWSCCRADFPLQCLHDPLQQRASSQVWDNEPKFVIDSINTRGCLPIVQKPITLALSCFVLTTVIILAIDVIVIFIARWLYTSSRNALLLSDPQGVAPGWIFGRGDCGYKRGKSIYDIMNASKSGESKSKEVHINKLDETTGPDTDRSPERLHSEEHTSQFAKVHNSFGKEYEETPSIYDHNDPSSERLNERSTVSFKQSYSSEIEASAKRKIGKSEEDTTTDYDY